LGWGVVGCNGSDGVLFGRWRWRWRGAVCFECIGSAHSHVPAAAHHRPTLPCAVLWCALCRARFTLQPVSLFRMGGGHCAVCSVQCAARLLLPHTHSTAHAKAKLARDWFCACACAWSQINTKERAAKRREQQRSGEKKKWKRRRQK
jgi:hypothetical protein